MDIKDCCKNPENLGPPIEQAKDLTYRVCKVCGCRHFEAIADLGGFGIEFK